MRPADATAVALRPDWLWPHWIERQGDPTSPSFMPPGPGLTLANVTDRNWTAVGHLSAPGAATVDQRGLVSPGTAEWSLDWWVGAEDRWHIPGREVAVRQTLLDATPVVETAMRIPGGDAVHRVSVVTAGAGDQSPVAVIEVENRSATPVAVAFAVRPYNPSGLGTVHRIALDGTAVLVDGAPAVYLPRPPAGSVGGTFAGGDSFAAVIAGQAAAPPDGVAGFTVVDCRDGFASAAFVYPVPHHTSVRLVVPLPPGVADAPDPARLPGPADVARGWSAQLRRGLRMTLPDARLQAAVDANRAYLLMRATADVPTVDGARAGVVRALDAFGFHAESAEALAGAVTPWSAGTLVALADHHRLIGTAGPDRDTATLNRRAVDGVVAAIQALLRPPRRGFRRPEPADRDYRTEAEVVRGLLDGAWLLRLGDDEATAAKAERAAADRTAALDTALTADAARLGRPIISAAPGRDIDSGMIHALAACVALWGLEVPDDAAVAATLDVIRDRFCAGEAFCSAWPPVGLSPALTLALAAVELDAGDPRAWRRLRWVLEAATPAYTWPGAVHPRLGTGTAGPGHDPQVVTAFLLFVRRVLVREVRADEEGMDTAGALALLTVFPPEWAGQNLEVTEAPTHFGRLSYAVRWHGDRPALLWELDRPGVLLTAPGLDRTWSTMEQSGEALLGPHRRRIQLTLD